jgi:hypothetical protein
MRKFVPLAAGLTCVALLSGCGAGRSLDRARPDEFAVARQAPLVIPPDFALVPPQPGAAEQRVERLGVGCGILRAGGAAARSPAESGVIADAGADNDDPGIRSSAGDPGTTVVDKGSTTRDIVAAPEGDGQDARTTAN